MGDVEHIGRLLTRMPYLSVCTGVCLCVPGSGNSKKNALFPCTFCIFLPTGYSYTRSVEEEICSFCGIFETTTAKHGRDIITIKIKGLHIYCF